jgi:gliding motility-associated-like protein
MKWNKISLYILLFSCFITKTIAQNITVDDTYTAQQLVHDVLINSPCANVENFTVNGDTFSSGAQSYGFFNGNSSSFPFASGVVLSTARANRSPGPNNNLIDEGNTAWLGDIDLEQALGISNTFNATVLEFDFTPLTNQINFDYIFASEEYQGTAPCRYSDGFAFLLKPFGSSTPYTNLAVIPNTTTPVLVTSVHPIIIGGCAAKNETYFGGYNGVNAPINFNGQTTILTAKSAVTPNVKYHIKLVIADHENIRYDSAIFLSGGSFRVGADLGPDKLIALGNPICYGATYPLNATQSGTNTYKWYKNNVLLPTETNPILNVTSNGIYKVEIALGATACIATSEVTIEFAPPLNPTAATLFQCDDNNDGTTIYNLTKANPLILANDSSLLPPVYYENQSDANPIANPTAFQTSTPKTIYALVKNALGCSAFIDVQLKISNNTIAPQSPIVTCDDDSVQDGLFHFDLNSTATPSILLGLPLGLIIKYYATANEALTDNNVLPNDFYNTVPNQQIIWAKAINGTECYGLIPITLQINTFTAPNFGDEIRFLCDGHTINLAVPTGFSSYLWDNTSHSITNEISVSTANDYTVTVTDSKGCKGAKKFIVTSSGKATITSVTIDDFEGGDNSVLINYSGIGSNYEFSLDGIHFQDSPYFTNVISGEYTITINDKNGCEPTTAIIYVLDYPKFFTPNNDGVNDVWKIPFLNFHPKSFITIFDRYGKLVYSFYGNGLGWDGKLNTIPLPATDYWFVINIDNNKIVRGHFALKR